MNLITSQLNKPMIMTQATNTSVTQQNEVMPETSQGDKKSSQNKNDFFTKNKAAFASACAVVLGGIAYAALSHGKTQKGPATHIERINAFGKKIIEDLKLSPEGKIISKEITTAENKYLAVYTEGRLTSVDDYIPLSSEILKEQKYTVLKSIMDEIQAKVAIFQDLGESKNYYLIDAKGEKVTEINEYQADPKAMYQYLTMKLSGDKSKVYEIAESYSAKDNAAFAEIFENFKE